MSADSKTTPLLVLPPNKAIVIVAKCPIAGKSKTRLAKTGLLDDDGCATMARAMLSDVISYIHTSEELRNVVKFIYHAPPSIKGRRMMQDIFKSLNVACESSPDGEDNTMETCSTNASGISIPTTSSKTEDDCSSWNICGMPDNGDSLQSSDLGSKLAAILEQTRTMLRCRYANDHATPSDYAPAVAFVGMDSPELPLSEIFYALDLAVSRCEHHQPNDAKCKAYINPSHDGGYGMLCLPHQANASVFEGVRWSSPLTAVSQIKAITDSGIDIEMGSLMRDIDEAEDLIDFGKRLYDLKKGAMDANQRGKDDEVGYSRGEDDVLSRPPPNRGIVNSVLQADDYCKYSWTAMTELKIFDKDQ